MLNLDRAHLLEPFDADFFPGKCLTTYYLHKQLQLHLQNFPLWFKQTLQKKQ